MLTFKTESSDIDFHNRPQEILCDFQNIANEILCDFKNRAPELWYCLTGSGTVFSKHPNPDLVKEFVPSKNLPKLTFFIKLQVLLDERCYFVVIIICGLKFTKNVFFLLKTLCRAGSGSGKRSKPTWSTTLCRTVKMLFFLLNKKISDDLVKDDFQKSIFPSQIKMKTLKLVHAAKPKRFWNWKV